MPHCQDPCLSRRWTFFFDPLGILALSVTVVVELRCLIHCYAHESHVGKLLLQLRIRDLPYNRDHGLGVVDVHHEVLKVVLVTVSVLEAKSARGDRAQARHVAAHHAARRDSPLWP